jgi:sulfatase modifying factor 1
VLTSVRQLYVSSVIASASLAFATALLTPGTVYAGSIVIETVAVGNPGNANDATGYGGVNYEYRIGKYEVTLSQYSSFLNSVASGEDTYGLYNNQLGANITVSGINRTESGGASSYSPIGPQGANPSGQSAGNRPVTYATWFAAARFANWMSNGQPSGPQASATTEDGAYTLNGITSGGAPKRNAINPNTGEAPLYWIPTENEWYKAAYYSPALNSGSGGYYLYATQSDAAPGNLIGSGFNQANGYIFLGNNQYSYSTRATPWTQGGAAPLYDQNYLTDVGAFTSSGSYYGTSDQNGNVWEWNDLGGQASTLKGFRGGNWDYNNAPMRSTARYETFASGEDFWSSNGQYMGFRVAAAVAVPEPSTLVMAMCGLALASRGVLRRRRAA